MTLEHATELCYLASVTSENPYLDEWRRIYGPDASFYGGFGLNRTRQRIWDHPNKHLDCFTKRDECVHTYAFSCPTPEAIDTIAKHGPVVEIGAGTGYWAKLLRDRGVDVRAFDLKPPSLQSTKNYWYKNIEPWSRVEYGGAPTSNRFPERSLMLSWPPYGSPMASTALRNYYGDTLIYIGESYGGCCADNKFFTCVEKEWTEVANVMLPQWEGLHDMLWVYQR